MTGMEHTTRRGRVPGDVDGDDGADDAAIPGADAVAVSSVRARGGWGSSARTDGAGGRGLLRRLGCPGCGRLRRAASWRSTTRPLAAGLVLLMAGGAQLTSWKARQLALCREGSGCGCPSAPDSFGAWRHGLQLGVRCGLCCGSLMLALLASGMMNPVAMAGATLAISVERLAPAPMRVARAVGVALVVVGVLKIAGAA